MASVRETLSGPTVHDTWTSTFHGRAAQPFFDAQFDQIATEFRTAPEGDVLDAGCGPGHHTRRLTARGFSVVGADFSAAALEQAQQQLSGQTRWVRADLTRLPFDDSSFPRVLCYGVLMHVPEIELAVAELARVLTQEGVLVVSEGNMYALDNLVVAVVRRFRGKPPASQRTKRGTERYLATPAGPLFIRHSNIPWLVSEFEKHGLVLRSRQAGQFSEAYVWLPARLGRLVSWLNRRRLPTRLAFGTLLTFERPRQGI